MNKEIAELAIRFLLRTPLNGEEVPAFNAVMLELEKVLKAE